ncbi:MAG: peptidase inhibitor family I36 protein [Nanoarchaeota archaeon]|mgnify:CR=1 FL=1
MKRGLIILGVFVLLFAVSFVSAVIGAGQTCYWGPYTNTNPTAHGSVLTTSQWGSEPRLLCWNGRWRTGQTQAQESGWASSFVAETDNNPQVDTIVLMGIESVLPTTEYSFTKNGIQGKWKIVDGSVLFPGNTAWTGRKVWQWTANTPTTLTTGLKRQLYPGTNNVFVANGNNYQESNESINDLKDAKRITITAKMLNLRGTDNTYGDIPLAQHKTKRGFSISLNSTGFLAVKVKTNTSKGLWIDCTGQVTTAIPTNEFTDVALTWDGAEGVLRGYVNHLKVCENPNVKGNFSGEDTAPATAIHQLRIGGNLWKDSVSSIGMTGKYFKGQITNIRLYDRVLTDAELTQIDNEVVPIKSLTCEELDFNCNGVSDSSDVQLLINNSTQIDNYLLEFNQAFINGVTCVKYKAFLQKAYDAGNTDLSNEVLSVINFLTLPTTACATTQKRPPCGSYGDVDGNGFVTEADTALLTSFFGSAVGNDAQKIRADLDGNNFINTEDQRLITLYGLGTITTFPVCTATALTCEGLDFNCDGVTDNSDVGVLTSDNGLITNFLLEFNQTFIDGITCAKYKAFLQKAYNAGSTDLSAEVLSVSNFLTVTPCSTAPSELICTDADFNCDSVINGRDSRILNDLANKISRRQAPFLNGELTQAYIDSLTCVKLKNYLNKIYTQSYGGKIRTYIADIPYVGDEFDNVFSSISLDGPATCKITLYAHKNYANLETNFTRDTAYIGDEINNEISSVKIEGPSTCKIILYEDRNYVGISKEITANTTYVGDNFNDKVSSIKVPAGCKAMLYQGADYREKHIEISSNMSYVGDLWNDEVSSIKVPAGCSATLYESINFIGLRHQFPPSEIISAISTIIDCTDEEQPALDLSKMCENPRRAGFGVKPGTRIRGAGPATLNNLTYCDPESLNLKNLKALNANCNDDYECLTNVCIGGKCTSISQELQSQRNILQQILCFLKRLFRIEDASCPAS